MFKVPESSSPPSTPDSGAKKFSNPFFSLSNPSTTPAGPPPRTSISQASTTPAGPPPSSVFGRSNLFASSNPPLQNAFNSSPLRRSDPHIDDSDMQVADDSNEDMMGPDDDGFRASASRSRPKYRPRAKLSHLAKSFAKNERPPLGPDETILSTESILNGLHGQLGSNALAGVRQDETLAAAAQDLVDTWEVGLNLNRETEGIGPGKKADPTANAVFLASLALAIHNRPFQAAQTASLRSSRALGYQKPMPEVLLDWLKSHHQPFPDEMANVFNTKPNPTSNDRFWDVIFSSLVRGYLREVSGLLKEADFQFALTAYDDGSDQIGYHGKQLGNVKRVINRAIQVLGICPAVQNGDWNVRGQEWTVFRKKVHQAITDLETLAEGSSTDRGDGKASEFQASHFGLSSMRSDDLSISEMSRRAESKVPWSVYQNLQFFYGHLLGTHSEIVSSASDWLEATLGIAIWWDGSEGDAAQENLSTSRRALTRSQPLKASDNGSYAAYQKKLAVTLHQVTAESDDVALCIDTTSPVEVAATCILENNLEGLVEILQSFSSTVGTAVVEIARAGSWPGLASPKTSLAGFDESDLMVLSYGARKEEGVQYDNILAQYANLIAQRGTLRSSVTKDSIEGWQLALQILRRLSDSAMAQSTVSKILGNLDLKSWERVEQVTRLCGTMGLTDQMEKVSERYADHLLETTQEYGQAVYYYSKAHNHQKVKDVLDLLSYHSLVQSRAYPSNSELDPTLAELVSSPQKSLAKLDKLDHDAAATLSRYLSGYSTLRNFYNLRDDGLGQNEEDRRASKPRVRKKEAASALLVMIESASDAIHGGLYDSNTECVVRFDGLLLLLGEALMFANQIPRMLDTGQIFAIMKAVEDLSTVSNDVYDKCEELLRSALASAHGTESQLSSVASMSASYPFSLVGSSMLKSGLSSEGSGILSKDFAKRAWDWRKGLPVGASGQQILQMLRLGLARDISKSWVEVDAC